MKLRKIYEKSDEGLKVVLALDYVLERMNEIVNIGQKRHITRTENRELKDLQKDYKMFGRLHKKYFTEPYRYNR